MKIKIESDVFDIVERIKEIDDGYFVLYDTITKKFEVHNYNQINSYCFTSKNADLDNYIINEILNTLTCNIDNIIECVDKNNDYIERNRIEKIKDDSDFMLREIFNFSNNSSKEYNCDIAFSTVWR